MSRRFPRRLTLAAVGRGKKLWRRCRIGLGARRRGCEKDAARGDDALPGGTRKLCKAVNFATGHSGRTLEAKTEKEAGCNLRSGGARGVGLVPGARNATHKWAQRLVSLGDLSGALAFPYVQPTKADLAQRVLYT